jgi:hypothetical protein
MSGVAIEELLGLWSAELQKAKDRLRPLTSISFRPPEGR